MQVSPVLSTCAKQQEPQSQQLAEEEAQAHRAAVAEEQRLHKLLHLWLKREALRRLSLPTLAKDAGEGLCLHHRVKALLTF